MEASLKEMACRHKLDPAETAEMGAALGGLLSIHYGTDWDERLSKVNSAQVRARTMAAIQTFCACWQPSDR